MCPPQHAPALWPWSTPGHRSGDHCSAERWSPSLSVAGGLILHQTGCQHEPLPPATAVSCPLAVPGVSSCWRRDFKVSALVPTALRGRNGCNAGEKVISPISVVQMQHFFLLICSPDAGAGSSPHAFPLPWGEAFPKCWLGADWPRRVNLCHTAQLRTSHSYWAQAG